MSGMARVHLWSRGAFTSRGAKPNGLEFDAHGLNNNKTLRGDSATTAVVESPLFVFISKSGTFQCYIFHIGESAHGSVHRGKTAAVILRFPAVHVLGGGFPVKLPTGNMVYAGGLSKPSPGLKSAHSMGIFPKITHTPQVLPRALCGKFGMCRGTVEVSPRTVIRCFPVIRGPGPLNKGRGGMCGIFWGWGRLSAV